MAHLIEKCLNGWIAAFSRPAATRSSLRFSHGHRGGDPALGDRFDAGEIAVIELFREYGDTVPEAQLIEEIGLAVAIHRRQQR